MTGVSYDHSELVKSELLKTLCESFGRGWGAELYGEVWMILNLSVLNTRPVRSLERLEMQTGTKINLFWKTASNDSGGKHPEEETWMGEGNLWECWKETNWEENGE